MTETVEPGKVVSITYSLRDEQGKLYEYRDLPVSYLHGADGEMFPKVEQALAGKSVGDKVIIELSPEEGFGERVDGLSFSESLDKVPEAFHHVGVEVELENDRGESRVFYVTGIEDGTITFDANHPLADQTVEFDVTIVDIRPATSEEMMRGTPVIDSDMPQIM